VLPNSALPGGIKPTITPASIEIAARVDRTGRAILAANPSLGIKPLFTTIGAPLTPDAAHPAELFHRGTSDVYITEALARCCTTDAELAALLCMELGRMIAEREARVGPTHAPDDQPPPNVSIAGDTGADQTRMAELARFEARRRQQHRPAAPVALDPRHLASEYLQKAGYAPQTLDRVAPLLSAAQRQGTLEQQITRAAK
jgi:hypothetical protein